MRLILRAICPSRDMGALFAYAASPETQSLFMRQASFNSQAEFDRWLMRMLDSEFHDFCIVSDDVDGAPLGFTFSYDFRPYDGHCKLTCCAFSEVAKPGVGATAGLLMADRLFRSYPLRCIYTEVYSYNGRSLRIHEKASHGWKEVAVFEGYRYLDGDYHDLHVFRMERDVFYRRYSKLASRLRERSGAHGLL